MKRKLSKSRYTAGLQCPKMLWFKANQPDLAAETSTADQMRFDLGTQVGELATDLFGGGVLAAPDGQKLEVTLERTVELRDQRVPAIFEATVEHDGVLCMADILARVPGEENLWDLYEVKSTNSLKDQHLPDVAVQKYCFEGAGYPIRYSHLTHLNKKYVRKGDLTLENLFVHENVDEQIVPFVQEASANIPRLLDVVNAGHSPDVAPGGHCRSPYKCAFFDQCNAPVPPYTIADLTGRSGKLRTALAATGVQMLADVPDGTELSPMHRAQVKAAQTGQPVVDEPAVLEFLSGLAYPIRFFDFETVAPPVPQFDNSRPWQALPCQYSVHTQQEPGGPCTHGEFLAEGREDPREALIQSMLSHLGTSGSIIVWYASFEGSKIKDLARDFPAYADELKALLPRIVDLMDPFKDGHYWHRDFGRSTSIKVVLPALVPSLSYKALPIQDGDTASNMTLQWFMGELPPAEWAKVRKDLLDYCQLDTLATVEILRVLQDSVK